MFKSLQEKYAERHLQETRKQSVLLEALDAEKLGEISKAIDALNRIIPQDKMSGFYSAVKAAKDELAKASSGGLGTALVQKFTQPVSRAVTLADSLKTAFKLTPQLIKTYAEREYANDTTSPIDQIVPDTKKKQFIQAFLNAARPAGIIAGLGKLFSSGSGLPFVTNAETAVAEMMQNMSVSDLTQLARGVQNAPETISPEVAKELQASQTGTQATQATNPTDKTQGTEQTNPHPEAYNYIKGNIEKLTTVQKKELFDMLSKQVS